MPTSRELVSNKSLSGPELSEILISDFTRLVHSHGLLCGQTAFPRVGYEIRLTLHLENATTPTLVDSTFSRTQAVGEVTHHPPLAALEPGVPLNPRLPPTPPSSPRSRSIAKSPRPTSPGSSIPCRSR